MQFLKLRHRSNGLFLPEIGGMKFLNFIPLYMEFSNFQFIMETDCKHM